MPKLAKYRIACECGGVSSTVPYDKARHDATEKHKMWVNGTVMQEPLPLQYYPIKKFKCDCGGMTSTIPFFKTQHENTNKHQRWVKTGSSHKKIIDCPCGSLEKRPKRHAETKLHMTWLANADSHSKAPTTIANCPCGAKDKRTNRHIDSERHKIWMRTCTVVETRGGCRNTKN
mgnify:CR=1 FL=1